MKINPSGARGINPRWRGEVKEGEVGRGGGRKVRGGGGKYLSIY